MKYKYSPEDLEKMASNEWLTDREKQVFDLYYRRGWRIQDIAEEIKPNENSKPGISRRTVINILKSIRDKALTKL